MSSPRGQRGESEVLGFVILAIICFAGYGVYQFFLNSGDFGGPHGPRMIDADG